MSGSRSLADRARFLLILPTSDTRVQFLRYLVVGGIAFVADFGTLWILTSGAGLHYLTAAAIGFLLGLGINYALSVAWVFSEHRMADRRSEFLVFALIGLMGLGLNELGLWLLTGKLGIDYRVSKLLTTGLVFLWNFVARKLMLFAPGSHPSR